MNYYKYGQQSALNMLGLLKTAQGNPALVRNPGLAGQMQAPTWGLGGATPQGFRAPSTPAPAPTPPQGAPATGTAPQPQKPIPAPSQPVGPSPAAAPGPASPFRQPSMPRTSRSELGIPSGRQTAADLGIAGGRQTASSLGIPSGGKPF